MSTISASTTSTTAYKVTADTTGTLVLQTGASPTTAVTISSGQVVTFAQAPVLPAASIPQAALAAGVAGNGPAMQAYASITQSVTQFTGTVIQVNTEVFDTNGCFNNTGSTVTLNGLSVPAYSFCPNVAGYYQVNGQTIIQSTTGVCETYIYKNGATVAYGASGASDAGSCLSTVSMVVYLNGTGDYIQLATWHNNGTAKNTTVGATGFNNMSIALVRAA